MEDGQHQKRDTIHGRVHSESISIYNLSSKTHWRYKQDTKSFANQSTVPLI